MPVNKAAEDAWLTAVAEDPIEDLAEIVVPVRTKEAPRSDEQYMAWMEFYTYPLALSNLAWQITCKGCGEIFERGPMYGYTKRGKKVVVKSGRERVMGAVETHIYRGHRDPHDFKPSTYDEEPPF